MAEEISLREHLESKITANDRRYSELREADKRAVDKAFETQQTALQEAKADADRKNSELNDVRLRFVSRETFEKDSNDRDEKFDNFKKDQQASFRWMAGLLITAGIAIVGLTITIIGMLMSWKTR